MKKEELSTRFNTYIAELLSDGFALSMTELRGGYGFFGQQTCFAKGRERVVIWMEENRGHGKGTVPLHEAVNEVHLLAARFDVPDGEGVEWHFGWPNKWKEHLVSDWVVYEVERDKWYVESLDECLAYRAKHYERCRNRLKASEPRKLELTDELLTIARRIPGFKKCKREAIDVWRNESSWVFHNLKTNRRYTVSA